MFNLVQSLLLVPSAYGMVFYQKTHAMLNLNTNLLTDSEAVRENMKSGLALARLLQQDIYSRPHISRSLKLAPVFTFNN